MVRSRVLGHALAQLLFNHLREGPPSALHPSSRMYGSKACPAMPGQGKADPCLSNTVAKPMDKPSSSNSREAEPFSVPMRSMWMRYASRQQTSRLSTGPHHKIISGACLRDGVR